jgi:hypothetical protein
MCIAWVARLHRETLFPLRKEIHLQKVIRGCDAVDSRQPHLFHQTVLERCKQSFNTPLGVSRGLRRNVSVKNDDFALLIPIIRGADRNLN